MKKVLVTGGAGFIGSHLVDRLLNEGYEVFVVDNLSTGKRENLNPEAGFFEVDITDFDALDKVFSETEPEYVFHQAAIPRMPISIKDPVGTSKTNILGTINVLKAAHDAGVKRVVYAASSSAYGEQETLPLHEDMVPNPLSPYGLQKYVGELKLRLFSSLYGLPTVSLRYFNVYGPRIDVNSDYSLVVGKFLRLNKEGKRLPIFGDGKQSRAFCYVGDVVEANIKAMLSPKVGKGEVINIGAKDPVSVEEIAEAIGGEKEYLPPRAGDPMHTAADLTRAIELLEWEPKVDFVEGLRMTKEWFESL
ncbi:MAG: SDR family oxidoreductase [Candidatus Colwellbacteria bacterium]|nr:SDR family oxidoreductase [Candidatus Colwellbacteria bacterium]